MNSRKHQPAQYSRLPLSEKFYPHLLEIDQAANERLERLMPPMVRAEGITEVQTLFLHAEGKWHTKECDN